MAIAAPPRPAQPASNPLGTTVDALHAGASDQVRKPEARPRPAAWQASRYRLQTVAARLLYRDDRPVELQHATCWCNRGIRGGETATLHRRTDGAGARLGNVLTCQRPWTCPVCCLRIANARADELRAAVEAWCKAGGLVYLATYTFPHEADDPIGPQLERFYDARQRYANSRTFKGIREATESPGVIRSTEVTYGRRSGWHPHLHELLFVRRPLTVAETDRMRSAWVGVLQRVGLVTNRSLEDAMRYSLDVRGGEHAAEYIAKFGREESWGLSAELTKRHAKVGRDDDRHKPFALLQLADQGEGWAGDRFREYAAAFASKKMLTWSPGLRARLGLGDELPDDQVGADEGEEVRVATLTAPQLAVVQSRRALPDLLELVALCCDGPDAQSIVDDWIAGLRQTPRGRRRELVRVPRSFGGSPRHMAIELPEVLQ